MKRSAANLQPSSATQVDVDHLVFSRPGFVEELAGKHDSRVVHHDVERAVDTRRVVEECRKGLRRGHIQRQCDYVAVEIGRDALDKIGVEVSDRYLGSRGHKSFRGGQADPRAPPVIATTRPSSAVFMFT